MHYIISQIFVILSYLSLSSTYFLKNRKSILIFSLIAVVCNAFAFFFLAAWSGFIMSIVALIRNLILLVQNKYKKTDKIIFVDWLILTFFILISIVSAIFTFDGFGSLLSIIATLVYTISVWQKNIIVYKVLGICSSVLWIGYGIYIISLFSIILESILLLVEIIGIIKANIDKRKT